MQRSRSYNLNGKWYKGNIHIHSTVSDGGKNFHELAELYSKCGYDFLYRTDHWICSDVESESDDYPVMWLDGVELNGKNSKARDFHILCLGKTECLCNEMGLEKAVESAVEQGAVIVLAHPYWMGNDFEDCFHWKFAGVEKYNHVTGWLNGKSDSSVFWDKMLEGRPETLSFAVDDAHITVDHPGYNGGWICVNAEELSRECIHNAIKVGNFYSSCGPEIEELIYEDGNVKVKTSGVNFIRLVGPGSVGRRVGNFDGKKIYEACFEVPTDWGYAYLDIEDEYSKHAWTNNLIRS